MKNRIEVIDWTLVTEEMHAKGFSIIPNLLGHGACDALAGLFEQPDLYRKTVVMERYRFGLGEYKYFHYPLPNLLQTFRESIYPHLVPIANLWMEVLKTGINYPPSLPGLHALCREQNQVKPTVLI